MNAIAFTLALMVPGFLPQSLTFQQTYSVPEWVNSVMERSQFASAYQMDAHLNPFCQRADFDGDGRVDFAAFIRERSSGKIGIAFFHRSTESSHIVGAGILGLHGDDYSWVDAWSVFEKGVVPQGTGEGPPPTLQGDALLIFKTEASSAMLWWSGTAYHWYQQGD